jgi:outer membrane protein assembly factor BamE (lipoprotein component of BamABCDE complex)
MKTLPLLALLLSGCAALDSYRTIGDADLARIRQGMSHEETRQLLGPPAETMAFARTSTQSWDYVGQDSWGYLTQYSVIFGPQGTVVSTATRRINDGGDHGK